MPACCRCNGNGRCRGCSCTKAGRLCTGCLPSRKGQCYNQGNPSPCVTTLSNPDAVALPASEVPRENSTDQSQIEQSSNSQECVFLDGDAIFDDVITETGEPVADLTETASSTPLLPSYREMSCDRIKWQGLTGQEFSEAIDEAYSQTAHWIPNLFMLPSRNCGKQFIGELAKLFDAFAQESAYEAFAIKAAMTMPSLLLQKPHSKSKTQDHVSCVSRRLALWEQGDVAELLKEGKLIQSHLRSSFGKLHEENNKLARTFSRLMI